MSHKWLVLPLAAIAAVIWLGAERSRDRSAPIVIRGDTLSVITVREFSNRVESGWDDRGDRLFSIGQDRDAPVSPPHVGIAAFPAGFTSGSGPISTSYDLKPGRFRTLYVTLWIRFSENWFGNAAGINKVLYVWHHAKPAVAIAAVGSGEAPMGLQVRLQDLPGGTRNLVPQNGKGRVERGPWQHWEFLLTTNTPGASDGEVRWWIDGTEAGYYRDVVFGSSAVQQYWELLAWNPTYGGKGPPVPRDQAMVIDHLMAAGR